MFGFFDLILLGLYVYIAIAAGRAEAKSGANAAVIFTKAATWPLTIWHTINKLYLTKPK